MKDLETQVGQIYISDRKLSKSFISLYSEKYQETGSEAYFLMEIPLLNPAIWNEYEQIAARLQASFRRNLKKSNPNAFENAVAQVNDDLSAVASEGQTSWVGKLAACLATKQDDSIYIATTGKIHAYLYREGQLSNIADTEQPTNPLKTFSNFAQGKIKEKDVLIFSTGQLFNYISIERLKSLLSKNSISEASTEIAEIIKTNADENVSFATFLLKLSPTGSAENNVIDLGQVIAGENSFVSKVRIPIDWTKNILAHTLLLSKKARIPQLNNPKISVPSINFREIFPSLASVFKPSRFKNLSRPKKFFLIAAAVFILALIVNLGVIIYSHSKAKRIEALNIQLDNVENKINSANAAFIIHDENKAINSLNAAQAEFKSIPDNKAINSRKQLIESELKDIENTVGHIQQVDPLEMLTYTDASVDDLELINNQLFLINRKGSLITAVNVAKKAAGKNITLSLPAFKSSASADGNLFFEDEQGNIYTATPDLKINTKQAGKLTANTTGFAIYGSPEKAYAVQENQIIFTSVKNSVSTSSYIKDGTNISGTLDLAIDGSIYLLTKNTVIKFTKGAKQSFYDLGMSFSDNSRIKVGTKNIYIMDPGARKIIIRDKIGNMVGQLISDKFDDLRDIAIDEVNQVLYVMNGSHLYSIRLQ